MPGISDGDLSALIITLKLAGLTTLILLILGTPLAWWLARSRWRFKFLLEAIVALPLVLPPTVLGFYLLVALGPHGPVGGCMEWLGGQSLAFTFSGQTQVLSIAIYDHVEMLEYGHAHWLSGGLLLLSFLMLMVVYAFNRRFRVVQA